MMMCDKDCYNCQEEDCIFEGLTPEEIQSQDKYDYKLKSHSTEKQKQDARNYYWRHREKCLEKNRKYYHSHKEKFREYERLRRIEHPVSKEKQHEYYIRWRDKKRREQDGKNIISGEI